MSTKKKVTSQGYVLLDVLMALFLFSIGFVVLFGLTEAAVVDARQASVLMEGANLAQKTMDSLAGSEWSDNFAQQTCLLGGTVEGNEGNFHWTIRANWEDVPQLLRVSVEVNWTQGGIPSRYKLESLYALE